MKVWLVAPVIRKELTAKLAITLAFNISGNIKMCIWNTRVKGRAFSFESFFNVYFVHRLEGRLIFVEIFEYACDDQGFVA